MFVNTGMFFTAAPAGGGDADTHKSSGIRGPKVMPAFDPTKARAGLKKASVAVSEP